MPLRVVEFQPKNLIGGSMGIIGRGSMMIGLVQTMGLVQEFVSVTLVQFESSSALAAVPNVFNPPRSRRHSKARVERDFMMGV
jgi:hypothetical protein